MAWWRVQRRGQRMVFEFVRRLGIVTYHRKLARVRCVIADDGVFYEKKRYWRTPLLVAGANAVLRATDSLVLGLPEREWLDWEIRLAPLVLRCTAQSRGSTLRLPKLPGVRLADYLAATREAEAKWSAVRSAARELKRLHGLTLPFPDGVLRSFSHGDAHYKNVLFDAETAQATWFDFEAIHAPTISTVRRHADDWRTFAFSTAICFKPHELPHLALLIAQECSDEAVCSELRSLVARLARRPDTFHLAQAPLDFTRHQAFCAALQETLPKQ